MCWMLMVNLFAVRTAPTVVVVRSIEETVEIVVEASTADDAHDAALGHLKAKGDEYEWKKPRTDFTVRHTAEIDTPAVVDVTVGNSINYFTSGPRVFPLRISSTA
jgi:hypothetical protein